MRAFKISVRWEYDVNEGRCAGMVGLGMIDRIVLADDESHAHQVFDHDARHDLRDVPVNAKRSCSELESGTSYRG